MFTLHLSLAVFSFSVKLRSFASTWKARIALYCSHICTFFFKKTNENLTFADCLKRHSKSLYYLNHANYIREVVVILSLVLALKSDRRQDWSGMLVSLKVHQCLLRLWRVMMTLLLRNRNCVTLRSVKVKPFKAKNSDRHQSSPRSINAYSTPEVMRIKDMITQG